MFCLSQGGLGKGLPLSAKIYTPDGYNLNGDMKVGDSVLTPNNSIAKVVGVYPQGLQKMYKIHFKNGETVKCDENHLWKVGFYKWKEDRILNIKELKSIVDKERDCLYINATKTLDFNKQETTIDPYFLGYFIGNGRLDKSIVISTKDKEIISYIENTLGEKYCIHKKTKYDYGIIKLYKERASDLISKFRELGYSNSNSYTKFIPKNYIYNTKEVRWSLLQGLMDSDGTCEKTQDCYYTTSSKQLATDFKELAQSLGCICYIKEKIPYYTYSGKRLRGHVSYTCKIRCVDETMLFRLKRKKVRARSKRIKYHLRNYIYKIEELKDKEETSCIKLDKEFLYLTDNFIVTHNTTAVMKTLEEMKVNNFVYVNSYSTPVELVNILYENRDKLIIFDDVETIFQMGLKIINIFKGVLWGIGTTGKRQVSYNTTSKLLKAPTSFEFNGKLIFLVNKLPNKNDPVISAMMSRSLVYEMKFTKQEVLEMLREYSLIPYGILTQDERTMLYEHLKDNTDSTSEDLSFRTLIKIYDIYTNNKTDWKSLIAPIITKNEKLVLIKRLIEEHNNNKKVAQGEFVERTGMSRASFYRLASKI